MSEPGTPKLIQTESVEQKVAELKKFMLPEVIQGVDGRLETYGVLYNAESLLEELKKQREGGKRSSLADSIKAAGLTYGRLLDKFSQNKLQEGQKEVIEEVCPDYILTEDGVILEIFTDDNEQLAKDLTEYFRPRAISLYNHDLYQNHLPNLEEEVKDKIFSHLNLPYLPYGSKTNNLPTEIKSKDNCIDIGFEVYPGIASQVRFVNSSEGGRSLFGVKNDFKFKKKLMFNNPIEIIGYVSGGVSPDLAMQLDLIVFLKKKGHVPGLKLSQNAGLYYDLPDKEHHSFAV
jgi:hypothetical protein